MSSSKTRTQEFKGEKVMKKTLAKLIATVTTIALVVAAPLTVFAEENKFGPGDDNQVENEEAQDYYKSQVERLEQMKKEKVI